MAVEPEDLGQQLLAKAVHHRHDDDQRRHAEHDAEEREPGDDRDEAFFAPRPQSSAATASTRTERKGACRSVRTFRSDPLAGLVPANTRSFTQFWRNREVPYKSMASSTDHFGELPVAKGYTPSQTIDLKGWHDFLAEFRLCFHAHCGTQFCGIGAKPANLNWIRPGGYMAPIRWTIMTVRSIGLRCHALRIGTARMGACGRSRSR